MENSLLNHFFPAELLLHFAIAEIKELGDVASKELLYAISLEVNNVIPKLYKAIDYESKGFYTEVTIQDFPIRGEAVYLLIKRRRWRHKNNPKDIICNDYSFIAEGSKLTKELADFLKETGRYTGRYD